jgi:two-component system, cell cycle sensor histidine kinase and response regulator CckA
MKERSFVGDWQSIRRRLPLLTTALLSIAVVAISWSAYVEMERSLVTAAGERVLSVSQQVAGAFMTSNARLQHDGSPLSHDSTLRNALLRRDARSIAAARRRLEAEARTNKQVATLELLAPNGSRVLAVDIIENPAFASTGGGSNASPIWPLIASHDTIFTEARLAIVNPPADTVGYLRQITRMSSSAQSKQLLGGLIGDHAMLLVGNSNGRVWTDLEHRVDAPVGSSTVGVTQHATLADGTEWIGATAAVRNAPWLVWVALPASIIADQTRPFLLAMVIVDLLVIVAGAFGAWILSRHLISPLAALTSAAEELAAGDYGARVSVARRDEVGRLATAFNEMAGAIQIASHELQEQAVELETQQAEIEESNAALTAHVSQAIAAQESAERAHARSAAIVYGAMDAVITAESDGTITEFNPAAEQAFGYAASDIVGSPLERLVPVLGTNGGATNPDEHGVRMEVTAIRADGAEFPAELAMTHVPVPGRAASLITCFVRDLSDRKQLEAQLQQSQKMDAVGRLAGGIAHDFNNILTVIVSYSDLILGDDTIQDPARGDLVQVRAAADRAAALTRQLLAFSRKQVLHPVVLDLNAVVNDVGRMLARVIPENIRLDLKLGAQLDSVYADRGQLEQVLMNLTVNARDAMPKGGALIIETANAMLDREYVAMHPGGSDGAHVVLCVHDTGIGMDARTRERIFEPFFTTKALGQGTGLGLATVYGIVRQSGGSIYVYSEPGRGTTFKVYFPKYVGDGVAGEEPVAIRATSTETMTVLLVEDDAAVREATRLVLERLGHEVVATTDVAAALEILRSDGNALDVVLTDAVMPGQSGLDLAAILHAERPDLPVILMSGYTEEAVSGGRALEHGIVFVEKPFTREAIRRALDDVRAASAPGVRQLSRS